MNSVERVRDICKERKIPISRLEKDLGFSNGYISQLRKGIFPADRLAQIAEYFGVSTDYLLNGEKKEKTPALTEKDKRISDSDLKFALWGNADIDDSVLDDVKRFAKFAEENRKKHEK